MAIKPLLALLLFSTVFISPAISGNCPPEILAMCKQTPNSEMCEDIVTRNTKYHVPIKGKSDFFKLSILMALDESIYAHKSLTYLGSKCRNDKEKAAWSDCINLYESTVHHLRKSIDRYKNPTSSDAQTWLSTALTNIETCKSGFSDFSITDYVFPMMSNNVSVLLCNALAMNDGDHYQGLSSSKNEDFPSWLSPGDRKLLQVSSNPKANIVVAQDGSGNYKTVNEAIGAAAKSAGNGRFVIYVKQGTYSENVNIGRSLKNIMLIGDGIGKTIITGSRSVGGGTTTFNSATFAVVGDGFIAKGITFRNTAGPGNHQAVAVRSGSDLSVFYQCSFEGYQDTLYVHSQRQFYRECDIYGTVDFIFGNAAVVLQNCNILVRNPPARTNTITAQGRTDSNQNTGISIQNCVVTQANTLSPGVKTYLGRPWQQYSRTIFMESNLGSLIDGAGWLPWSGNFALDTLYYGEYSNTGPGSSTANRVNWKGFHVITSPAVASQFTPGSFIAGNSWLPATGVVYKAGL